MVGTAISVVTTVPGPTVILSTLLAHRVVYNVVRLVLNTVIKMQKNEFCLNFYTAVLNTNLGKIVTGYCADLNALFDVAYDYKICIFAINSDTINRPPAMLYGDGYVISYCFPDWLEQEVHSVGKYADSHGIFRRVYDPSNGGYSGWNAISDSKVTLQNGARLEMYSNGTATQIDSFVGDARKHRLVWSDGGLSLYKYSGTTPTKIWESN